MAVYYKHNMVVRNKSSDVYAPVAKRYDCSIIEMNTGIICTCLPNLRTFAKHHFPSIFNSSDESESQYIVTYWTETRTDMTSVPTESDRIRRGSGQPLNSNTSQIEPNQSILSIPTTEEGQQSRKSSIPIT